MANVLRHPNDKENGFIDLLFPIGKVISRSKSFSSQNHRGLEKAGIKPFGNNLCRSKSCIGSLSHLLSDHVGSRQTDTKSQLLLCHKDNPTRANSARTVTRTVSDPSGIRGNAKCLKQVRSFSVLDLRNTLSHDGADKVDSNEFVCDQRFDVRVLTSVSIIRRISNENSPCNSTGNLTLELGWDGIGDGSNMINDIQRRDGDYFGGECGICYTNRDETELLTCSNCRQPFCFTCLQEYVKQQIKNGCISIVCPEVGCGKVYSEFEVEINATDDLMSIYVMNHAEAMSNPRVKACPGCNLLRRLTDDEPIPKKLTCFSCRLDWCFNCHAPWHSFMTCRAYQKDADGGGRRALKVWAKSTGKHVKNARKCPKCKFFIERIAGCDHMTCSRCRTDFCYSCGKRFLSLGILGNHYSRLSFLGCKNNLLPNKPFRRIAVRGAIIVVAAPLVVICALSVAPLVLPIAIGLHIKRKGCC